MKKWMYPRFCLGRCLSAPSSVSHQRIGVVMPGLPGVTRPRRRSLRRDQTGVTNATPA